MKSSWIRGGKRQGCSVLILCFGRNLVRSCQNRRWKQGSRPQQSLSIVLPTSTLPQSALYTVNVIAPRKSPSDVKCSSSPKCYFFPSYSNLILQILIHHTSTVTAPSSCVSWFCRWKFSAGILYVQIFHYKTHGTDLSSSERLIGRKVQIEVWRSPSRSSMKPVWKKIDSCFHSFRVVHLVNCEIYLLRQTGQPRWVIKLHRVFWT